MYVLRYNAGGPALWTEFVYNENIEVRNRIALTEQDLSKQYLMMNGFVLLGTIEDASGLEDFLKEKELIDDARLVASQKGKSIPKVDADGMTIFDKAKIVEKKPPETDLDGGPAKWYDNKSGE